LKLVLNVNGVRSRREKAADAGNVHLREDICLGELETHFLRKALADGLWDKPVPLTRKTKAGLIDCSRADGEDVGDLGVVTIHVSGIAIDGAVVLIGNDCRIVTFSD